jgi:predicted short-subunit dehydrogenase-like oxidoreductase (DUF2520 family)
VDIALVGPGRAGTAVTLAMLDAGHRVVTVAGRTPDAASTRGAAARFGAQIAPVEHAGRGADLVLVATPDDAIAAIAGVIADSVEPHALVLHLSGALGLDVLEPVARRHGDVSLGALHPLQTLPSAGATLVGAWAAVAGPPAVAELARELGMHPFTVRDGDRATYHAAAVVASNHVVALTAQVQELAATAGVPFEAFESLARGAVVNAFELGPAAALTGPVARGDVATVQRHLAAIPAHHHRAYRALAEVAMRLSERDDPALRGVLA